jgi:formylglycine-generating enzyme required for sulfatase activity/dienelactone hydrolase/tRNA A-37 threonylcarbamoyl transferase component Bud32
VKDFSLARFQEVLAGRYRTISEIGQGGMATVYLAEDLRHHRQVAIKVLDPELGSSIGLKRFLQEIELVAALQHPHLLTLIDSGDVDGLPYYVMPFVEGQSLREMLAGEERLPVDRAVAIACEIADGLHYAHQRGVVHRDIKPSNILMSGGHPMVADFGIATALERATVGRITQTGVSLGSPTYMSPEQAAGERDLDARTDVYSLGCVLYEMLCGGPPVESDSMQHVVTQKLLGSFRRARELRPDIQPALDAALSRALEPRRENRWVDAEAFANALREATSPPALPGLSRGRVMAGAGAVAILLVLVSFGVASTRARRALEVTRQLAEIERLASDGAIAAAYELAGQVAEKVPNDTALARLRPMFTDFLNVVTDPPGALLFRRRYDAPEDAWELVGRTPLDSVLVPKRGIGGFSYRFRVERAGYRPVDFLPHILSDWAQWRGVGRLDTLRMDREEDLPADMVRVPAFQMADNLHEGTEALTVGDYFMDRYEVNNAQYKAFLDAGGYSKPEYWIEPFERDGAVWSRDQAMREFVDRTGRPGPSTWELGTFPEGQGNYPVSGISWYEAAAYARFVGKELPSSWHWVRAALRHQRETSWIYIPESNLGGKGPRPVGGAMNAYGLYDIAGNVREWGRNRIEGGRVTRGGAWGDAEFHVGWLIGRPPMDRSPDNGIRLVRQSEPDSTAAHFLADVRPSVRKDFTNAKPVGDAEFRIYARLFDYDSLPLAPATELSDTSAYYRMEKVTFAAAYGGERMAVYVFLPRNAQPPYQPIIFWPGSGAMTSTTLKGEEMLQWVGFIPRSGRALVLPLYKGSYERDDAEFSTRISLPQPNNYYRDLAIQWVKDLRRTIDWLETRKDMDAGRVGLYGISWGGQIAPVALAVEPRVRATALDIGGLWAGSVAPPEVEPVNYLPRVTSPVLMLNGRYDVVFDYETSQLPFFRLLGTPAADKRHYVYPTSHEVPMDKLVPLVLDWFDRYLGPVGH